MATWNQAAAWMAGATVAGSVTGLASPADAQNCTLTCPAGAIIEPETCGGSATDGCNLTSPQFVSMNCGETACGTLWADGDARDTDWYEFSVSDPDGDGTAYITLSVESEFSCIFLLLNNDCATPLAFAQGEADDCAPGSAVGCVAAPGTYRVFVSTGSANGAIYDGIPCGSGNDYQLTVTCDAECISPSNDACANAEPIEDGATFFTTVNATTDGPAHALCLNGSADDQVHSDVWYRYTASCTGDLIIDACNSASFDTRVAVYDGCACPVNETRLLACADDLFGCDGNTSALFVPVVEGQCYLIRLGGFDGAQGLGTIRLSCLPGGVCPDAGDCFVAHETPSCNFGDCCSTVCAFDPFCCLVVWDDVCADEAAANCNPPATVACCFDDETCLDLTEEDCIAFGGTPRPAGTDCAGSSCAGETEACCLFEGVCLSDRTAAECIALGGEPQGPGSSCATESCLPGACCFDDGTCVQLTGSLCVDAGGTFFGAGTTCDACPQPCDEDCDPDGGDGQVDVSDLLKVLAEWGQSGSPADVAPPGGDGQVNVTDLLAVLGAWGPCL